MKHLTPIDHADRYRAYSSALRLVSSLNSEDLHLKARIVHYLYESGNVEWLKLVNLPCDEFGRAFDASRAKGN